jgi:mono/diheme cytochrome c family protein
LRIVVPLAILAAICAFIFGWLTFTGMSARTAPGSFETFLGRTVQRLSIPKSARSAKSPMESTPEALVEARRHFADHCASCHANDGSGKTAIGQNLYPRVPDMRLAETTSSRTASDSPVCPHGERAAPATTKPGIWFSSLDIYRI